MRGYIFSLIVLLFILSSYIVVADVNCQYKDIEQYNETEVVLIYKESTNLAGKALVFSDFTKGNRTSFMVYNPNPFKIRVFLKYIVEGWGGGEKSYGIVVEPLLKQKVEDICFDKDIFGECYIKPENITYFVMNLENPNSESMIPTERTFAKTKSISNKPCSKSSDCGTGICNGAGFCSDTMIIDCCPEGTGNCNNKSCLKPSNKEVGQPYSCDWECKSGVGTGICKLNNGKTSLCSKNSDCYSNKCNFDGYCGDFLGCRNPEEVNCGDKGCFKPGNRTIGEAYSCSWQCETRYGKDGVCDLTIIEKVKRTIYWILWFLVVCLSTLIIWNIREWKKSKKFKEENKVLKEENKNIKEKNEKEKQLLEEKHKEDIRNKTKSYQNRIEFLKEEFDDKKGELLKRNKELEIEISDLKKREEEKELILTEPKKSPGSTGFWWWRNPNATNPYYPCYANLDIYHKPIRNGNIEIHKDLAKKEIFNQEKYREFFKKLGKPFDYYTIHHINKNPDNFEPKNLVFLSPELHGQKGEKELTKVIHSNITDWDSGIVELKRLKEELKKRGKLNLIIAAPHIPKLND